MSVYYVYGLHDVRKPDSPLFYIGKGKNLRWRDHIIKQKDRTCNPHKGRIIEAIAAEGMEPSVTFFGRDLTEEQAYALESELIQRYGREGYDEGGILTNVLIEAKPPCRLGWKMPESTKRKIGDANRGGKTANYGQDNGFFGRTHSDKTKDILRQKCPRPKGYKVSADALENMKASFTTERRAALSQHLGNRNRSERMRQLTRDRNRTMGRNKTLADIRINLNLYVETIRLIASGMPIKDVRSKLGCSYMFVWKVSKRQSYYDELLEEILNERG